MTEQPELVSATNPDRTREVLAWGEWNPGKRLLASIRCYHRHQKASPWHSLIRKLCVLRHRLWTAVCSSDLPLNCQIGGGLILPHPYGIVIHPAATIGPNCLIFQGVTLGTRESRGAPVIGGHVDIGAGAKILGSVKIGDHAVIGANAVVLIDVPSGATAVGIPAKILSRRSGV